MFILGISAFYHDSAACLIKNGLIVAAAQEERFTRKKHDHSFPINAIKYCLKEAEIEPDVLTNVIFYEKPFLKFERLLETYLAFAPKGFRSFARSMPLWVKDKLFQKSIIIDQLKTEFGSDVEWNDRLLFSEHHLSHAASAFYPSPFRHAAVLTLDGVGEWATTSLSIGRDNKLELKGEITFPHSLGLLYSAFTYYLGFKVNSGEYKVMGLAPYGEPRFTETIKKMVTIAPDGSFQLDMSYFNFATGLTMVTKKFEMLLGGPRRVPDSQITQKDMDIAASIQKITEEIVVKLARDVARQTGERNLCLAGGVALNCVVNGILLREKIFENIWVQPAAGDAGGALGAALCAWHLHHNKNRVIPAGRDGMSGSYLGPKFNDEQIRITLDQCGAVYQKLPEAELIEQMVAALVSQKAIGLMQGRMEFGPRALGGRSIIADPRSSKMQKQLNLKVKYRESFRPFAPSILREDVNEWFEHDTDSPYMLMVANVRENKRVSLSPDHMELSGLERLGIANSVIPAVTHVDHSARLQTVHQDTNPRFAALLSKFKERTGCPILVNTSFNIRGEPIVCDPKDAFRCFMGTELDILVIENYILYKQDQDKGLSKTYQHLFALD